MTFSYRLRGDFPGLPRCDTVFKGKAKAFLDPDTGKWNAEAELDDEGGHRIPEAPGSAEETRSLS